MKGIMIGGVVIFGTLVLLTTCLSSATAQAEAARYFSAEEIAQGQQFALERRGFFWIATGLWLGFLTVLSCTSLGRRLAERCQAWSGARWWLALLLIGGFCFLVNEAISLPLGLLRLEHLRSWGMTSRPVASWLAEHAKGLVLEAALNGLVVLGFYGLLRWWPRWWWLPAAGAGGLLGMAYAWLLPVLIAPWFNTFTPLSATNWANLQERVEMLAQRAGLPVREILVMDASRQGHFSNAYFTGFGGSRQIVLYDTLLQQHTGLEPGQAAGSVGLCGTPAGSWLAATTLMTACRQGEAEIESILAHEMGHWQHQHIVQGLGLATLGSLGGFLVLSWIMRRLVDRPPLYLTAPADPAGLPLILLLLALGSWLVGPLENAVSRHFERQADLAALELAGQPEAFIQAELRLARQNRMNVAPTPFNVFLFATHPPTVERIRMAEHWRDRQAATTKPPGEQRGPAGF